MTTMPTPITHVSTALSPAQRLAAIQERARMRREGGEVPSLPPRGAAFVKLDGNTGEIIYGADRVPFPTGAEFVVDVESILYGCVLWQAKRPTTRRLISILDGAMPTPPHGEPRQGDLPKPRERDGWTETYSIPLSGIEGELKGVLLRFDCSNDSSFRRAAELTVAVYDRIALSETSPELVRGMIHPIVKVTVGSYFNKSYDKHVYYPEFNIVAWTDGFERDEVGDESELLANILD